MLHYIDTDDGFLENQTVSVINVNQVLNGLGWC
jgi:hypothetical protein